MNISTTLLPLNSLVPNAFAVENPTIRERRVTMAERTMLFTVALMTVRCSKTYSQARVLHSGNRLG